MDVYTRLSSDGTHILVRIIDDETQQYQEGWLPVHTEAGKYFVALHEQGEVLGSTQ